MDLDQKIARLQEWLYNASPLAIAFSGGVDSAVLAKAAFLFAAKNSPSCAFCAVSPTSTAESVQNARKIASEIGIKLVEFETDELLNDDFYQNNPRRCYFCKKIRFSALRTVAERYLPTVGAWTFIEGSNADDALDYRPGSDAARELGFRAPLADVGLTKAEIRRMAADWSLSCADRPSDPCLATRVAFGLAPSASRLRQIEQGEWILRDAGFAICRLRIDTPDTARIEVAPEKLTRLTDTPLADAIIEKIAALGFLRVTIDPDGYESGKMNRRV